jgi:exosortase/archaeosortase family protein
MNKLDIVYSIKEYNTLFIKAAVIVAAVILMYMQDLAVIFKDALVFSSANITNYILIIPFLIAYIIYRKRRILIAVALEGSNGNIRGRGVGGKRLRFDDIIGLTLISIAVILYIYGSLTLYALEFHIYSIPLFVAGLTAFLFNIKVLRHAIFAIVILAYLQPPPAELLSTIAGDLSWLSATLAESMLKAYGLSVTLEASYGAPALVVSKDNIQMPFFVGEPSSGLFSTIGLSLFALIAAYIARGAVWKRSIMFIIGFPLFFFLNALRIAIILILWYHYGEQVSEAFHAVSGSIMAIPGTLIVLLIGDKLLGVNIRSSIVSYSKDKDNCPYCSKSSSLNEKICLACSRILADIKGINANSIARFALIALIISSMLAVNQVQMSTASADTLAKRVSSFDISSITGRERETVGLFLPELDGYILEYAYRDQRVEKVLRQDAALAYRYIKVEDDNNNGSNTDDISKILNRKTFYVGVQISNGRHKWEDSMLIYPSKVGRPTAEVLELKDVNISEDETARLFAYIRPNQKQAEIVLYWFERLPLRFNDTHENRNIQIVLWSYLSTLARNGFIKDENDIKGAEEFYIAIAKQIKAHYNAIKAQLQQEKLVQDTVKQRFPLLMSASIAPAALLSLREFSRINAIKNNSSRLYSRLSKDDKMLIDALINASSNKGYATTEQVAVEYSRLTNKSVSIDDVMSMLINARDSGLVKSMIVSINDEPLLVWKSNIASKT